MVVKEIESKTGGKILIHDDCFEDERSVELRKQNIEQIIMRYYKRKIAEKSVA